MNWSPDKFVIIKWDQIPSAIPASICQLWYDIYFQLKSSYPREKGQYAFTSFHVFHLMVEDEKIFDYAGRVNYKICLHGKVLDIDLLLLLVDRTHRLFNEEFDKGKKSTFWESFEVPDYDQDQIRNDLEKIIF